MRRNARQPIIICRLWRVMRVENRSTVTKAQMFAEWKKTCVLRIHEVLQCYISRNYYNWNVDEEQIYGLSVQANNTASYAAQMNCNTRQTDTITSPHIMGNF